MKIRKALGIGALILAFSSLTPIAYSQGNTQTEAPGVYEDIDKEGLQEIRVIPFGVASQHVTWPFIVSIVASYENRIIHAYGQSQNFYELVKAEALVDAEIHQEDLVRKYSYITLRGRFLDDKEFLIKELISNGHEVEFQYYPEDYLKKYK